MFNIEQKPYLQNFETVDERKSAWIESTEWEIGPETLEKIQKNIANPDKYIGEGGAAKVFTLDTACVKLIKNRHKEDNAHLYDLGNTPEREFQIQEMVQKIKTKNVFSPKVAVLFKGKETSAFVMEELDAVNMQRVILGREKLPEGFELESFFEDLEEFIFEMHENQIVHRDLEPRNIMIDRKTGSPRVIDFGRSEHIPNNQEKIARLEKKDEDDLEKIYARMKAMLSN